MTSKAHSVEKVIIGVGEQLASFLNLIVYVFSQQRDSPDVSRENKPVLFLDLKSASSVDATPRAGLCATPY